MSIKKKVEKTRDVFNCIGMAKEYDGLYPKISILDDVTEKRRIR